MTMKVFPPSAPRTQPGDLWSIVELGAQDGIALMDKINQGLEGDVAKHFSALTKI